MFARVDNLLDQHPKIMMAGHKGGWLFVVGILYSSRMLTDGFIPVETVRHLAAGIPSWRKVVATLVQLGMWQEVDGGYQIHDYLDYQESRADVDRKRQADRIRKSGDENAKVATPSQTIPRGIRTESKRNLRAVPAESVLLDIDVNTDPDLTDQTDHDQEAHAQNKKTPEAPAAVARPEMAALVMSVRQKAHLAPDEDDADVAQIVQMHLDLWPPDVIEHQAQAFDGYATKFERQGKPFARTVKSLDTFFSKIDPQKLARARRSTRIPTRGSPATVSARKSAELRENTRLVRDGPRITHAKNPYNRHPTSCRCSECQALSRTAHHKPDCPCVDCILVAPLRVRQLAHAVGT